MTLDVAHVMDVFDYCKPIEFLVKQFGLTFTVESQWLVESQTFGAFIDS